MPELPEVETVRQGLNRYLIGQTIKEMKIRNFSLRWPIDPGLPERVRSNLILATERRGKYMLWHFSSGSLIWHLGMSGVMRVTTREQPPAKHDHIDVIFANHIVRFTDPRRFGSLFYVMDWQNHSLLKYLGPEPLSECFNGNYLEQALANSKRPIKTALMDSHLVVGVGNIYANEALFLAKIHPEQAAMSLTANQLESISKAIKVTLNKAILAGGTTLKDFLQADGKPGYFRYELKVYGRELCPCLTCKTEIKKFVLGQRATYFCPSCQKAP